MKVSEDMNMSNWMLKLRVGRIIISAIILVLWLISSCTHDKGKTIKPVPVPPGFCDSIKAADSLLMTYACNVEPVMSTNCTVSCHKPAQPVGVIMLDTYVSVKEAVDINNLMCAVDWSPCAISNMPFGQPQMDTTDIAIIQEWISRGMQ